MVDSLDMMEGGGAEATETAEEKSKVARGQPELSEARKRLVSAWSGKIKSAKGYHDAAFKRMKRDQDFVRGFQWDGYKDLDQQPYRANVVLRHIQQRTAALYAKNPRAIARRRERIQHTVWDGDHSTLVESLQGILGAMQMGQMPDQQAVMINQEAVQIETFNKQMDKFAKTLEILYQYNIDEQALPFKGQMKALVRRAATTSVGYVKLGFQRVTGRDIRYERQIMDLSGRLAEIERIASDMTDGLITQDDPEAERLRLQIEALRNEPEVVLREGLTFSYPRSDAIIVDPACNQLREFIGAEWVVEEFLLETEEIQRVYNIDVGKNYHAYSEDNILDDGSYQAQLWDDEPDHTRKDLAMVWEVWSKKDGLVFTICDGFPDFLREPEAPEAWTERFWPWFPLVLNEVDNCREIYPPSDVFLLRDMQREINRARQGLKEHRRANRPKTIAAAGRLSKTDKEKFLTHPDNALIELEGLQEGQNVAEALQPFRGPPIEDALYNTNSAFEDIERVGGSQEANLGGTSGATATETSIAESSRMSSLQSNIDDLDDLLSRLAHAAGQILMGNVSEETVKEVVGQGAVWPSLTREQLAKDLYLEIEAGSTGRPNQVQEIQNAERIVPFLMQIPDISPEWLARELLRRMDDRLDLTDAFAQGMPSINAINAAARGAPASAPGATDPAQQGAAGPEAANTGAPPQQDGALGPPGGAQIQGSPMPGAVPGV